MSDYNRYGGSTNGTDRDHGRSGYGSSGYASHDERNQRYQGRDDDSRNFAGSDRQGSNYFNESYGKQERAEGHRDEDHSRSFKREWDHDYVARPDRGRTDRYDKHDEDRRVSIDETGRLIASNKVEGTRVYDRRGNDLGTIENFMVEKRSGQVEYAVLSFGGFLGFGERHYPLPWNQLTYDERMGGYVVDITERDLQRAPSHRVGDNARYDRDYSSHINRYYGTRH